MLAALAAGMSVIAAMVPVAEASRNRSLPLRDLRASVLSLNQKCLRSAGHGDCEGPVAAISNGSPLQAAFALCRAMPPNRLASGNVTLGYVSIVRDTTGGQQNGLVCRWSGKKGSVEVEIILPDSGSKLSIRSNCGLFPSTAQCRMLNTGLNMFSAWNPYLKEMEALAEQPRGHVDATVHLPSDSYVTTLGIAELGAFWRRIAGALGLSTAL